MTLHVAEVGVIIVHGTSYTLTGATDLELYLLPPGIDVGGVGIITVPTARITSPAVLYAAPAPIGDLASGTYMQFTTTAVDFVTKSVAGGTGAGYDYKIYGRYTDGTKVLYSEPDYIIVHAEGA